MTNKERAWVREREEKFCERIKSLDEEIAARTKTEKQLREAIARMDKELQVLREWAHARIAEEARWRVVKAMLEGRTK